MKLRAQLRSRASSLIEVTLAMGVVAFGLVAILGVMPKAFDSAAASQNETRAMEIAQRLFSAMANQPYDRIVLNRYGFDGGQYGERILNFANPPSSTPGMEGWSQSATPATGTHTGTKSKDAFATRQTAQWSSLAANAKGVIIDTDGGFWFLDRPPAPVKNESSETFAVYKIRIAVDNDEDIPEIADKQVSRRVTIRISWPPHQQNYRDYWKIVRR